MTSSCLKEPSGFSICTYVLVQVNWVPALRAQVADVLDAWSHVRVFGPEVSKTGGEFVCLRIKMGLLAHVKRYGYVGMSTHREGSRELCIFLKASWRSRGGWVSLSVSVSLSQSLSLTCPSLFSFLSRFSRSSIDISSRPSRQREYRLIYILSLSMASMIFFSSSYFLIASMFFLSSSSFLLASFNAVFYVAAAVAAMHLASRWAAAAFRSLSNFLDCMSSRNRRRIRFWRLNLIIRATAAFSSSLFFRASLCSCASQRRGHKRLC